MLKLGAQVCFRTLLSNFVKSPVVDAAKKENLVLLNAQLVRKTSFFGRLSKQQLWKGVLSVSNAGRRKGRGSRRDSLYRRSLDSTKTAPTTGEISWPGLNTHVLSGFELTPIKPIAEKAPEKSVQPQRQTKKSRSVNMLDRSWSGRQLGGKKLGPPKPFQNQKFLGFESVILMHKSTAIMTSVFGKKRKFTSIVATGNGNGLLGVGMIEKFDGKIAIKVAQKRASKKLITIDLIEKHTVNHNFFSQCGKTRVIAFKMPQGFGLKCHRVITEICKLIGIENLHAKVEGPCNVPNIIKAFVMGLLNQKTYQKIADEKNLHLVEFREEAYNFPLVLASPKECLTLSEARKTNIVFDEYILGNRLLYKPDKKVPFYAKLPSWQKHLKRTLYSRNHHKIKFDLLVKYGAYQSHLTPVYPECTGMKNMAKEISSE